MSAPERPQRPQLTEIQAARVEHARQALDAARVNRAFDPITLGGHVGALGWHLAELLHLVDELTAAETRPPATVAAFDRIAALLAGFDWEHDDSQYALEAIERIVLTGGER